MRLRDGLLDAVRRVGGRWTLRSNPPPVATPPLPDPFEERRQHAYNKIDWHVPRQLRGRFLDIGCGTGNGLVAALQHGFSMAVGIDRDLAEFGPNVGLEDRFTALGLDPSRAILIEADTFGLGFAPDSFDCVMLLDSIEHVPNPTQFIDYAARYLKPGGVLLLDTCPLYYSSQGGHLFGHFDPAEYPWVHLRRDFPALLEQRPVNDWAMQRFHELNKITHQDIRDQFERSGLTIIEEHRSAATEASTALLDANRALLDIDGIPEALLHEDWILLVGQRT